MFENQEIPELRGLEDHDIQFLKIHSKSIAVVRNWKGLEKESIPIPVDILLLCNWSARELEEIIPHFSFSTLVIDGSVNKKDARWVKEQMMDFKTLKFHVIPTDGAYLEDL